MQLAQALETQTIFPILGSPLNETNLLHLDFSPTNKDLVQLDCSNPVEFDAYIQQLLVKANKDFGIGGYNEHRVIYQDKNLFNDVSSEERCIHLGVDIWTPALTKLYAPLAAKIHSFQDNLGHGNYGPTIILEHKIQGLRFYSLYGHLSRSSLEGCKVGKKIEAGSFFCQIGDYPENGNWAPHLHFQLILDIGKYSGDYPGVCTISERVKLLQNCPNPSLILR